MRLARRAGLLQDRLAALPLVAFVALACAGLLHLAHDQVFILSRGASVLAGIEFLCTVSLIVFALQQAIFSLIRILPVARAAGLMPRLIAIASANCGLILVVVGREPMSAARGLLAMTLTLAGTLGSIATLAWLGKSFAVFPQARQLVTTGPYRFVRHPLYLTEAVGFLGVSLQFRLPWSLTIFAISVALQFARIGFEEDVLLRAFPAYAKYRSETRCLLPFLY